MIAPMLCEPSVPTDSDDYLWEVKWDGERAILFVQRNGVIIQNRRGDDVTYRYPELQAIADGRESILDGEVIVLDEFGRSNFSKIAQRSHLHKTFDIQQRMKVIPVAFMCFDILSYNGMNTFHLTLNERKDILHSNFHPIKGILHFSLAIAGGGISLFHQAQAAGLEGIVGKHIDSPYLAGKRSAYWKKCKCEKFIDLRFNRYQVNPAGIRIENDDGVGVQVTGRQSKAVKQAIDERGSAVCEIKYLNITEAGRLRMPTFKALKEERGLVQ